MDEPKKWALISVSDKRGVESFARRLIELNYGIISTGGTADTIESAGVPVTRVEEINGGEILGGTVKTLSREIFGGILATTDADKEELAQLGFPWIEIVVYNFYDLAGACYEEGSTLGTVRSKIDIGGPAGVIAAVKGQKVVVVDPDDYDFVIDGLSKGNLGAGYHLALMRMLQHKAVEVVSSYYAPLAKRIL